MRAQQHWFVISALRAFARLPLRWLHATGWLIGWMTYLGSPRYARRLTENLRIAAICHEKKEFGKLRREVVSELGKTVTELIPTWFLPVREVVAHVRAVEGLEHVDCARLEGRGIIFLTPHLGSFEIAGRYVTTLIPVLFLYRPPKVRWLEPIMNAGRGREDATMAPANKRGVRMMLKALREGRAVGVLPDQTPSQGDGVWADFFGRPAYTMTLIARLQQATGAAVIPFFAERLEQGKGYRVIFDPPLDLTDRPPQLAARDINAAIESQVRRCPSQYLWPYNRYKVPAGVAAPSPGRDTPLEVG